MHLSLQGPRTLKFLGCFGRGFWMDSGGPLWLASLDGLRVVHLNCLTGLDVITCPHHIIDHLLQPKGLFINSFSDVCFLYHVCKLNVCTPHLVSCFGKKKKPACPPWTFYLLVFSLPYCLGFGFLKGLYLSCFAFCVRSLHPVLSFCTPKYVFFFFWILCWDGRWGPLGRGYCKDLCFCY